ncbi:MAG: hypothetical protein B6240_13110 [Desulfobacteraceae bacterium 4572_87]|nr:MAG: hypothetical protein B6240_13110 [Desulfobacteraceae bacterium 4572_87]
MGTVKDYNEKYITKPFENSKDFVIDMKKEPKKAFEDMFDNGKRFVKDVKKDPKKVWTDLFDGGKDLAEGAREDIFKAVETVMDGGRDFYTGAEKDTRKALDDLLDRGKKITGKIPGKNKLEKGISKSLESVPGFLNLPSKKDMETLSKTVRTLNTKLNTLSKQCAA